MVKKSLVSTNPESHNSGDNKNIVRNNVYDTIIPNKQKELIDTMFGDFDHTKSIKTAVSELLEKLRDNIESGAYGIVIGIDGSGRLPALLVSETIKKIYEMRHIKTHIKTYFIAGNREPNVKYLQDFEKLLDKIGEKTQKCYKVNNYIGRKRMLVVDDIFFSGSTLTQINNILQDKWLFFDVAVLCLDCKGSEDFDKKQMQKKLSGSHTFYSYHGSMPTYYGRSDMIGLKKNRGIDGVYEKNENLFSKIGESRDGKLIQYVRRKIKEGAIDIAKQFIHEA